MPNQHWINEKPAQRGKHANAPLQGDSIAAAIEAQKEKKRKALWVVALLLCIVALIAGIRLTYSAFSASDFLKAVPVTGESQSLFASDTLASYATASTEGIVTRSVVVDTGGSSDKCSFTFRIYNCMLDDQNVFNDKEVVYTLKVGAKSKDGQEISRDKWSLSPAESLDMETTLPGTRAVVNTYTITFDKDLVDNATFTIQAVVASDKSPGTSSKQLAAKVMPAQRAVVQSSSVQGAWADSGNVSDYHAYNYRITVTGKTQTVTLKWGEKVELDPFFVTNHSGATVDRTNRTAMFDVEPGSEIVNFYRVGNAAPSSWNDIGVSVSGS